MTKFGRKWFLKCASLAYVNTAHNDGLLAEVDIADGEALVDEFERPAGRRLALPLLAHMIISSPGTCWQRDILFSAHANDSNYRAPTCTPSGG